MPQIVLDSYAELYDLCENHNRNGVLNPKDVAAFLNPSATSLLKQRFCTMTKAK